MKTYTFEPGQQGLIVKRNGDIEPFQASTYHVFTEMDVVMDAGLLEANDMSRFHENPPQALAHAIDTLAAQGYTVFQKVGWKRRLIWYWGVKLDEQQNHFPGN